MLKRLVGTPVSVVCALAMRASRRPAGLALVYHGIAPHPGDRSHELLPPHDERQLRRHVRHLRRHYRVVPAVELLAEAKARRRGSRVPISITFDDDLSHHVAHALPVLRAEGVEATFFLCGASLESPHSFWWERLQRAVEAGHSATGLANRLLDDAQREPAGRTMDIHDLALTIELLPAAHRAVAAERLLGLAGPDPPEAGLRADGVRRLVNAGMAIGFHTRRHDRLTGLSDDDLATAMRDGLDELAAVAEQPMTAIAYPHGRVDRRVAGAARDAGFTVGFGSAPIAITDRTDAMTLGRLTPEYGSMGEFALSVVRALLRDQDV